MRTEPRTALEYEGRATAAVKAVLIELGQVLGDYLSCIVIVGGAVPWLLLPDAEMPHVGTVDVDLLLNPKKLEQDGRYAKMIGLLENSGYERGADGLGTFQMRRSIAVDGGNPILVTLDLLKPDLPKTKKNKPPLIPDLRVQDVPGAEFAFKAPRELNLEGVMPDGRKNTVALLVADLPAFLVMKGFAVVQRDKPKDAYDIYYVIKHFPTGIEALADQCRPLMTQPRALEGFRGIAQKFDALDGYGAQTVRDFLRDTLTTPEEIAFVQRDAFAQVNAFISALGLTTT